MAYTVYKNTNTVLTTIEVGEVDDVSCSLVLVGKNVNNYGEYINNNFIKLLTNSAGDENSGPIEPLEGQLWYDTTNRVLKLYDGSEFNSLRGADVGGTAPLTTSTGDLWYDTENQQLKIWVDDEFSVVGPEVPGNLGKFGIQPPPFRIYDDNSNERVYPGVIHSYGNYIGMVSTTQFRLEASSSSIFINSAEPIDVRDGLTVFRDLEYRGTFYHRGNPLFTNVNGTAFSTFLKTDLSSYYDITRFGPIDTLTTSTNKARYDAANRAISDSLAKVYFTSTNYNQYPVGSQVKVICDFKYMATATTLAQIADTGTTTLYLSTTSGVSAGAMVEGSFLIPTGVIVNSIGAGSVEISAPVISAISSGTVIVFNTVTSSARHFYLANSPKEWTPNEIYTTDVIATAYGTILSTATLITIGVSSTNGLVPGLQLDKTDGTGAFGGLTFITTVTTASNQITIQSTTANTTGTIYFNAVDTNPPFVSTYTNIIRI